jgi:hypothetical protein
MDEQAPVSAATDIFAWANNVEGVKDQLQVELFLFNKKYTVYSMNYSGELNHHLKQLFLLDLLKYVNEGPDEGMKVRTFEEAESEELVIQRTKVEMVDKANYVRHQLTQLADDIIPFVHEEHDFKRIKGIMAKFSHASLDDPFYIVKQVQQSQVLKKSASWILEGDTFQPLLADATVKIPSEHQVMITGDDIFVFNQRKFETLYGYNAKQAAIAKEKVAAIEANFKLSFPEDVTMNDLVKDKARTIKKLQDLEVGKINQEQIIDHAEEMGIELMTDDAGAIIIMDSKDLDTFVNLLNDDYLESQLTGTKYEIRSKKALEG